MTEVQLNELHRRVSERGIYIRNSLQNHVPIDPLEEILQTNADLLKLIDHIQQFPQDDIDQMLKR